MKAPKKEPSTSEKIIDLLEDIRFRLLLILGFVVLNAGMNFIH